MEYYSTNGKAPMADLQKAVVKGLAEDRGLYMPRTYQPSVEDVLRQHAHYELSGYRLQCG